MQISAHPRQMQISAHPRQMRISAHPRQTTNRFEALAGEDDEDEWKDVRQRKGVKGWRFEVEKVDIGAVEKTEGVKGGTSRKKAMKFNVEDVKKPLASAAKVVSAGNRICMGPTPNENFIENTSTGENIELRIEGGTYVFDVEYEDGELGPSRWTRVQGSTCGRKGYRRMFRCSQRTRS